ncbi:hypothetical protein B0H13DRAFT_1883464 [Mycena leptocephala]|nr:hypothetical protein B0H13DRAFT_1883464 [Mycena leptocephala]
MAEYGRDHIGKVRRMFRTRVDPEDEFSPEWIGINKSCSVIPRNMLNFMDSHHHQRDDSPVDGFGRFLDIEWADQPDWYNPEDHVQGWIPLAREDDELGLSKLSPMSDGKWCVADLSQEVMKNDVKYFQDLMEEICLGKLYDEESYLPSLFDVERISGHYSSEVEVHRMVMDARRTVLSNLGHICWWMAATAGRWMEGLPDEVVQKVMNLDLMTDEKHGYLISVNCDWKSLNFVCSFCTTSHFLRLGTLRRPRPSIPTIGS